MNSTGEASGFGAATNTGEIASRIFRLVQTYVISRAERKTGIPWDSFKDKRKKDEASGRERMDVPEKFREARESIATQAFLRARACRSRQDFVDFFSGTVCSVPQFLPREEFERISVALLDEERWEDLKSLTMLALSSVSKS
ncbi:MAG: hypothetical protein U0R19_06595 [Bryobacteraceae bacterium]